jgi:uncharacterized membrane protein SpoIIM required for sporulation
MNPDIGFVQSVIRAIVRARISILTIALTYIVFITLGILFATNGNAYALAARDKLVDQAMQQNPTLITNNQGNHLQAALLDAGGNLFIGALPKTLSGLGIVFPYPFVAYQVWVGGFVAVRADHTSRLNDFRSGFYYLLTLLLHILSYSLAAGAGVNAGVSIFRPQPAYQGDKWLRLFPKEVLLGIARIYALVMPPRCGSFSVHGISNRKQLFEISFIIP